jgi:hypothetical protein
MNKHVSKPPSRIKYDTEHPTVSVRVSRELYNQLKDLCEDGGKSLGDILREAVKIQTPITEKAYARGYQDARRKFAVVYKCSGCGESIVIDSEKEKQEVAEHMASEGWKHSRCIR